MPLVSEDDYQAALDLTRTLLVEIAELSDQVECSLPPDFDYDISRAVTRRDWDEVELVLHRYRVGFW